MAAAPARFDRMVPAAPDAVGALRRQLGRWAREHGASPAAQANIALAFSEAATTVVGPVPPDCAERGPLILQAWVDGDELAVRVSHRSRGVPGPPADVGYGFGLALIAGVCERFEVRRREDGPGTAMQMVFRLERPRAPARSSLLQPSRSTTRL